MRGAGMPGLSPGEAETGVIDVGEIDRIQERRPDPDVHRRNGLMMHRPDRISVTRRWEGAASKAPAEPAHEPVPEPLEVVLQPEPMDLAPRPFPRIRAHVDP